MSFLFYISEMLVPVMILGVVLYGISMRINVYDEFVEGAKKGISTVFQIMPTLIGLMLAVGILRASGVLDLCADVLGKVTAYLGFPSQLVPLAIIRMFSSSAATGLVIDVFREYGPDSRIGMIASIMMSCTETIFYTMSVYFLTAKIKKTRHTLSGALLATIAGIVASVWLAGV